MISSGAGEPLVLQVDAERFEIHVRRVTPRARGDGEVAFIGHLAVDARRGLGLEGTPPVALATELVRFLAERHRVPDGGEIDLVAAAAVEPGFVDELRARLA